MHYADENVDSTYKKTSDSLNFYKFSELTERDDQIDSCTQTYTQINELTPLKADLLLGFHIWSYPIVILKLKRNAPGGFTLLGIFKDNDVQVWTGISNLENNSFYGLIYGNQKNIEKNFS